MNYENRWHLIKSAVVALLNQTASFSPFAVSIQRWLIAAHEEPAAYLVTHGVLIFRPRWWTLKGSTTDYTGLGDRASTAHGLVVTLARAVFSGLLAKRDNRELLATNHTGQHDSVMDIVPFIATVSRTKPERIPAILRNMYRYSALLTLHSTEGDFNASA